MYQTIRLPLQKLLDLLFPLACLGCGDEGRWLCATCEQSLPSILANHCPFCEAKTNTGNTCANCRSSHFLDGAISCIPYAHPLIQTMIHAWKYNGVSEITPSLAHFVLRSVRIAQADANNRRRNILQSGISKHALYSIADTPPLITGEPIFIEPIPLHPKREKERGFNQAYLLARHLVAENKHWEIAHTTKRTKKTEAQAQLSGIDRYTNIAGAFELTAPEAVRGKHVVLLDDVITTGSTTDALARLFKKSGALSVWALTIAYGHPVRP